MDQRQTLFAQQQQQQQHFTPKWELVCARYTGNCCQCGERYSPGDHMYWKPGQICHADCLPVSERPQLPQVNNSNVQHYILSKQPHLGAIDLSGAQEHITQRPLPSPAMPFPSVQQQVMTQVADGYYCVNCDNATWTLRVETLAADHPSLPNRRIISYFVGPDFEAWTGFGFVNPSDVLYIWKSCKAWEEALQNIYRTLRSAPRDAQLQFAALVGRCHSCGDALDIFGSARCSRCSTD